MLEFSLTHNGNVWCAQDSETKYYGKDLFTLEENINSLIKIDSRFKNKDIINVILRFNMDNLPRWLHQYHCHYFNYSFTVTK